MMGSPPPIFFFYCGVWTPEKEKLKYQNEIKSKKTNQFWFVDVVVEEHLKFKN